LFKLDKSDKTFSRNPQFDTPALITEDLAQKYGGVLGPEHCDEYYARLSAARDINLIRMNESDKNSPLVSTVMKDEELLQFETVAKNIKVISEDKMCILIDKAWLDGDRDEGTYEQHCVQIHRNVVTKKQYPVSMVDGLWVWDGKYDEFLGYYAEFVT
jgi:hypothetical protein